MADGKTDPYAVLRYPNYRYFVLGRSFFTLASQMQTIAVSWDIYQHLHVITNSLSVAIAFARNPEVEITFAGGTLRPRDRDIIGDAAAGFFSRFKADFGIFGVGGIDSDGALLDFYAGEVEARQAIVANCRSALLVADHSKFGRRATVRGGHLGDMPHLFTDEPVAADFRAMIENSAGMVHVASAN